MSLPPEEIDCTRLRNEIERFVDDDLDPVTVLAFRNHLAECAGCRDEVTLAREIREELRSLLQMDAPAAVLARVRDEAARDQARSRRTWWLALQPLPIWAAAGALVLVAVLGPVLILRERTEVARAEPTGVEIDAARLERATEEARVALAYVGQVSRRTGLEIRDGVLFERLVKPAAESLSSLKQLRRRRSVGEANET